jgi:hypothetical protein
MRMSLFFLVLLWGFHLVFCLVFLTEGVSSLIDTESVIYSSLLVFEMSVFLCFFRGVGYTLILMLMYYFFLRYLLASFNFLILSHYGQDTWMMMSYAQWLTSNQVNTYLMYGILGFQAIAFGLVIGNNFLRKKDERYWQHIVSKQVFQPLMGPFFVLFIIYVMIAIRIHLNVGYGSMAGIEATGRDNLYNLVSPIYIGYVIIAWAMFAKKFNKKDKLMFLVVLFGCVIFYTFIGSRKSLYDFFLLSIVIPAVKLGNYKINGRYLMTGVLAILCGIALYPVGKTMKQVWLSWNTLKEQEVSQIITNISHYRDDSLNDTRLAFFEITDRLADATAPITIINDRFINSVDDQINLVNTFKRAINDVIPGTVFQDVIPSTILYEYIYRGRIYVYGGEEWGILGVYYTHFGYWGSLLALFLSGFLISFIYKRVMLAHWRMKPVVVIYVIILFARFIYNGTFEAWLATALFADGLRLLIIGFLLYMFFQVGNFWKKAWIDVGRTIKQVN